MLQLVFFDPQKQKTAIYGFKGSYMLKPLLGKQQLCSVTKSFHYTLFYVCMLHLNPFMCFITCMLTSQFSTCPLAPSLFVYIHEQHWKSHFVSGFYCWVVLTHTYTHTMRGDAVQNERHCSIKISFSDYDTLCWSILPSM